MRGKVKTFRTRMDSPSALARADAGRGRQRQIACESRWREGVQERLEAQQHASVSSCGSANLWESDENGVRFAPTLHAERANKQNTEEVHALAKLSPVPPRFRAMPSMTALHTILVFPRKNAKLHALPHTQMRQSMRVRATALGDSSSFNQQHDPRSKALCLVSLARSWRGC